MELDFKVAYLGKLKNAILELESHLRIYERVIPTSALESRITGIVSCFDSLEERFESPIYLFLDISEEFGKRLP